jgi:hypothetical protein
MHFLSKPVFGQLASLGPRDPLFLLFFMRVLCFTTRSKLCLRAARLFQKQWETSRPSESSRWSLLFPFQTCLRTACLSFGSLNYLRDVPILALEHAMILRRSQLGHIAHTLLDRSVSPVSSLSTNFFSSLFFFFCLPFWLGLWTSWGAGLLYRSAWSRWTQVSTLTVGSSASDYASGLGRVGHVFPR